MKTLFGDIEFLELFKNGKYCGEIALIHKIKFATETISTEQAEEIMVACKGVDSYLRGEEFVNNGGNIAYDEQIIKLLKNDTPSAPLSEESLIT